MHTFTTDVLVVGAGPAGLTASALLARRGVQSLTVTKYGATADAPRAHITNQRAMEIFRDLGIEDRVMARALPHHLMGKQVFATSFAGREICRMMTWGTGNDRRADYAAASPSEMCNAPQHILEPILLDAARSFGADIRFDHEVVAVSQTADEATARVRKRLDGTEFEVRARYIVGCDGARTIVGEQGGFEFEGRGGLGSAITVWIEADLSRYTKHRSGALFFVRNPGNKDVLSVWTCVEPWTEWSTIFIREGLDTTELSEESVMPRVRAAIGDPSVDVRIKKTSEWQFNHVVAARYRRGRLFLAGDAAHRHPPANGLGSNTSIQDSYNLTWKLALVLSGKAHDRLLDSYDAERQPVGRRIVDRANRSVAEMGPCIMALGFQPGQTESEALAILDRLLSPDGEEQRQAPRRARSLERPVQRARCRDGAALRFGGGRQQRCAFPTLRTRPRPLLPPDDPSRRSSAARVAAAGHRGHLDPGPLPLRSLHTDHRHRRIRLGGRGRTGEPRDRPVHRADRGRPGSAQQRRARRLVA